VLSAEARLFRFDPPSASFEPAGMLGCVPATAAPITMAVDHHGTAFVTFTDGTMAEVSTSTATCTPTPFMSGPTYAGRGSCFAASPGGTGEALFMYDGSAPPQGEIVTVDTQTFGESLVGLLSEPLGALELTGTGDGRLFAFGNGTSTAPNGVLAELDPTNAAVLSTTALSLSVPNGFAFAFWGGDFYFFTGTGRGDSTVARLAADGTLQADYAFLPSQNVVGAGVSTCAPLQ
jgi:hypothetical protein